MLKHHRVFKVFFYKYVESFKDGFIKELPQINCFGTKYLWFDIENIKIFMSTDKLIEYKNL